MTEKTVTRAQSGQKLIQYVSRLMPQAPMSFFYRMLRAKNITLNRKKADGKELLNEGDTICFFLSDETMEKFGARPASDAKDVSPAPAVPSAKHILTPEMILYEDEDIILINKPAGILSQKAEKTDFSLNEMLLAYSLETGRATRESLNTCRPAVCNRLDRNTSGIVAAGFTVKGQRFLGELIREHRIGKDYLALLCGSSPATGEINAWLAKNESDNISRIALRKEEFPENLRERAVRISMSCALSQSSSAYSLVRIRLNTGKSHQIRAYFAWDAHPVVGDAKYGDAPVNREFAKKAGVKRQLLHASELSFGDISGEFSRLSGLRVTAPMPEDMKKALHLAGIKIN